MPAIGELLVNERRHWRSTGPEYAPKHKGINPFTGQEQDYAAKPATIRVKVRPLKKLKDAAL